jgi:nucleotide-binding universal stress UspA family protein
LDAPLQALTTEARSADLIVLGQTKGPVDAYRTLDNGAAVIGAGRPTLIVPETVNSLLAQNIIVGWKDTREARRAVQDSLPFLKKAKHISIVEICEAREKYAAQKNVEDVARYLKQHGIEAEARAEASHDQPDSDKFLDLAGREGADLLVLGAYGHSRFNEWVFGGMTRELMTTSPICCLFSH